MTSKRAQAEDAGGTPSERAAEAARALEQQDRVYSGLFGYGWVVGLLQMPDGTAYGQRIQFENGTEAELRILGLSIRH